MIYLILFFTVLHLSIRYDFNSKKEFSRIWYNFILFLFILVAGFRYKVGGDTQEYFIHYEYVDSFGNTSLSELLAGRFAFLWNLFEAICKSVSEDFVVLQLVHAIFVNIVVFWFIRKYSRFPFTSVLIYYLFAYLYFNMEIMRESISISFFLLAYPYFERKLWLKYYLFALVAIFFHISAVIIFVFPLLRFFKANIRSLFVITTLFIGFIILLQNNSDLMNLLLLTKMIEVKFHTYSEYGLNNTGKVITFISFIIIPLYMSTINKKLQRGRYSLFEDIYLVYFLIAITYVLFPGFSRFMNYMTPFMMIYFADLLNNIYISTKYRSISRLVVLAIFMVVFTPKYLYYSEDTNRFYPNTIKFNLHYPYSSIFDKKEYDFRDIIFRENMNESAEK